MEVKLVMHIPHGLFNFVSLASYNEHEYFLTVQELLLLFCLQNLPLINCVSHTMTLPSLLSNGSLAMRVSLPHITYH